MKKNSSATKRASAKKLPSVKKRPSARKRPSTRKHAAPKKQSAAKERQAAKARPPTKKRSPSAAGGSAIWAATTSSDGSWNTAANWNPAQVPTIGASFGPSAQTGVGFASGNPSTISNISFPPGASAYVFAFNESSPEAPTLTIAGAGVSNSSINSQHFTVAAFSASRDNPQLAFKNSASAGGSGVIYSVGPASPTAGGGGVIGFYDSATAGAAQFTVRTGPGLPQPNTLVGAEVTFRDNASAGTAQFTVFGSTSNVKQGDTFGNTVFHKNATAANAVFTNMGGTLAQCDGGNTQFFDNTTAANAVFHNYGGTVGLANGGDVAFDGSATAATGTFHNYASTGAGGHGGVTSFNNNWPPMPVVTQGASAGNAVFYNYGAKAAGQGGGHTSFSGAYGSGNGANGTFVNFGSNVAGALSCAGYTVFGPSFPQKTLNYSPNAGNGTYWNFPGTVAGAPGGNTQFMHYGTPPAASKAGNGGNGMFINLGANVQGALGGQTSFTGPASAGNAQLIATGGANGGGGGTIIFTQQASGGTSTVSISGNGTLDVSAAGLPKLTIGALMASGGVIKVNLGSNLTCLALTGNLTIHAAPLSFNFLSGTGFQKNTPYTILTAPNLGSFNAGQFAGNSLSGLPTFSIVGNSLQVSFNN